MNSASPPALKLGDEFSRFGERSGHGLAESFVMIGVDLHDYINDAIASGIDATSLQFLNRVGIEDDESTAAASGEYALVWPIQSYRDVAFAQSDRPESDPATDY